MPETGRFLRLWAVVLAASAVAVVTMGRYGVHVVAFGLLYASLATSWSWMRATGLFSFGQAAFFGAGALTQAWLVTTKGASPWLALAASAAAGAAAALPLIPALRLGTASFALATLAWAVLLKGLSTNVLPSGMEGYLLPALPGFHGAQSGVVAALAGVTLAVALGYLVFLKRPSGRAATAIRQSPETTLSLGIDLVGERWRPLALSAAATGAAGALYAHLVGSVETAVVFSPAFSVLPLVLGMLGGALHPLGGLLGTLVLYPLDELLLRPALPQTHTLAYGVALLALLLLRPGGLLRAPAPGIPLSPALRRARHAPFVLDVQNLGVRRNGTLVLRNVTFVLEPGEILRVVGPNGAGKTSLLLAIAGRLPAAEGGVFFGRAPCPRGAAARARLGLARTFQAPQPFPEWTVRENVALACERAGNPRALDPILADLQLEALSDRPAGRLSVGEGKRLELARALAVDPAILLLDEPLAGLSPEAQQAMSRLVERLRERGAAILWVEHGPAAGGLASRVLVLEGGRPRFLGSQKDWEAARHRGVS